MFAISGLPGDFQIKITILFLQIHLVWINFPWTPRMQAACEEATRGPMALSPSWGTGQRIKCLARGHNYWGKWFWTSDPYIWESRFLSAEPRELLGSFFSSHIKMCCNVCLLIVLADFWQRRKGKGSARHQRWKRLQLDDVRTSCVKLRWTESGRLPIQRGCIFCHL